MAFIYLFDLVDFDRTGSVCATKSCDLNQSRSNYLYLLSKYNQTFLEENGLEVPAFFKNELGQVLSNVEAGGDFEKAKHTVAENCMPQVQTQIKMADSEKNALVRLNEKITVKDEEFARRAQGAINNPQLGYIITAVSEQIFKSISKRQALIGTDVKAKRKIFRDVIKYNSLMSTADKVSQNKLSVEDFKTLAG